MVQVCFSAICKNCYNLHVCVVFFSDAHHLTVKCVRFRPCVGRVGDDDVNPNVLQLASCGADSLVGIYTISLDEL